MCGEGPARIDADHGALARNIKVRWFSVGRKDHLSYRGWICENSVGYKSWAGHDHTIYSGLEQEISRSFVVGTGPLYFLSGPSFNIYRAFGLN